MSRGRVLVSLAQQGRHELVRAFASGDVSIQRLEEAFETDGIGELAAGLRRPDSRLADACEDALDDKAPDVKATALNRYRTEFDHFPPRPPTPSGRTSLSTGWRGPTASSRSSGEPSRPSTTGRAIWWDSWSTRSTTTATRRPSPWGGGKKFDWRHTGFNLGAGIPGYRSYDVLAPRSTHP